MGLHASRLRWPEWVIGAGGIVLLVAMLLMPWYTLTRSSPPPTYVVPVGPVDGWNGLHTSHWLLLVTALAALAAAFFQAQRRAPAIPVTLCLLASILGGLSTIWLIVRVIIDPPGGRGIGGWIALIAAVAITYGGYKSVRTEGIARVDAPTEIPTIDLAGQATG